MRIARPGDLTDLTNLDLTMAEGKRLLAGVQQGIIATQVLSALAPRRLGWPAIATVGNPNYG
jgi:hypothetical protein